MAIPKLTRRFVIVGGATAAIAAACGGGGGDGDEAAEATAEPTDSATPELVLAAGFATGDRTPAVIAAGLEQRIMFTVADISGASLEPLRDGAPDTLEMSLHWPETEGRTDEITTERHDAGIPTPYYPIVFTPDVTGSYRVETVVDGTPLEASFLVDPAETIGLVQVGEPVRPVETPTFDDARGVDPICTRSPEPCPFHDRTLSESIDAGEPVALLVSTPGFCQTAICGPVLELLIEAAEGHPDLSFVHAEVYNDPQTLGQSDFAGVTEAAEVYGMTFEPSLVVANAEGIVSARLDFTFDAVDLDRALATATA